MLIIVAYTPFIVAAKSPLVQTSVFSIDLSKPTTEAFSAYQKWVESPEVQIGVLVNNAGVSHSMPVSFAETSLEEMENILQVVSTEFELQSAEYGSNTEYHALALAEHSCHPSFDASHATSNACQATVCPQSQVPHPQHRFFRRYRSIALVGHLLCLQGVLGDLEQGFG